MPNVPVELVGRETIRSSGERVPKLVDFLVQTTRPATIAINGDCDKGIHPLVDTRTWHM